ncbi:hypothetical protein [Natronoglycomyces albus]|uniref:Beta-ketoacyl-[acyl-carrier-protein] synthase III N-terminal domain-containing protein n=1 Tax=Natronoglycomyces albus TaxID=2811108 RepID=A0A895XNF0_9ACTN|nr:hypothetical protein [Natronoglycomyces albus]QSB06884.1 hypothetical protein JQS30_08355 [Natronoglycomyces albus]
MTDISAIAYVLGEEDLSYEDIPNWEQSAQLHNMAPLPELWGWGRLRRTNRDIADLAVQTGEQSLKEAGIEAADIDSLYLCCTAFPSSLAQQRDLIDSIQSRLGLDHADVTGVTLGRCTNALVALRAATAAVAAGMSRTALVITADRITNETERFVNFAIFSDGAASCVVTEAPVAAGYTVVAAAASHDSTGDDHISAQLAIDVNDTIYRASGIDTSAIAGLSHNNIYAPIVALKERQAGFTEDQLYTDNITRIGHCFAADPLINLADRERNAAIESDGHYLLAASVPGSRVAILTRRR